MTSLFEQKAKESELYKFSEGFTLKNNFVKRKEKELTNNYHVYWDYQNDIGLMFLKRFFPLRDHSAEESISFVAGNGGTHLVFPDELKKEHFYIHHATHNPYFSRDFFLSYRNNDNPCFIALCRAFNDVSKGQANFHTNIIRTDYNQIDAFLTRLYNHYAYMRVHS